MRFTHADRTLRSGASSTAFPSGSLGTRRDNTTVPTASRRTLQVVTEQEVLIAQKEAAVGDDGMRSGRGRSPFRKELRPKLRPLYLSSSSNCRETILPDWPFPMML